MAFAAWILSNLLADAIVAALVLDAFNIVAWIGGLANAVDILKSIWAYAHALVVAELILLNLNNILKNYP